MPRNAVYNSERRNAKINPRVHAPSPEDDICITGISGVFPKCKDINEFEHNLYNKVRYMFMFNQLIVQFRRKKNCCGFTETEIVEYSDGLNHSI